MTHPPVHGSSPCAYGAVPAHHAQAIVGHHSGRFHKHRAAAATLPAAAATQLDPAEASVSAGVPWSDAEATRFLQGLQRYGRDWDRMSYLDFNATRSPRQCQDFYRNMCRTAGEHPKHEKLKKIKDFPAWIQTVDNSQPAGNFTIVSADRWLFPLGGKMAMAARRGTGQRSKTTSHKTAAAAAVQRRPQKSALNGDQALPKPYTLPTLPTLLAHRWCTCAWSPGERGGQSQPTPTAGTPLPPLPTSPTFPLIPHPRRLPLTHPVIFHCICRGLK